MRIQVFLPARFERFETYEAAVMDQGVSPLQHPVKITRCPEIVFHDDDGFSQAYAVLPELEMARVAVDFGR